MITYPVNVLTDRFTFKLGAVTRRGQIWPRADGMQLQGVDPSLVILKETVAALPAYDPATHKLDAGAWVDDPQNQAATFVRGVVLLTVGELSDLALLADLASKRSVLSGQIATLRSWADQAETTTVTSGNAVATLQTMVTRLGVFFDRFADLLEVQGIQ